MAQLGMKEQLRRWHIFNNETALVDALVMRLSGLANDAIQARGAFRIVLAGGSTPARLYRRLVALPTDWSAWWILFGDERCLPAGAEGRNDTMARQCWLDQVDIPAVQILPIPAELGAEEGAARYANALAGFDNFDLVLLGLGEDGHTASLFPGLPAATDVAVPVHQAPKPPSARVSLSAARLANARAVWFIVTGPAKVDALQRWQRGEALPAASITPAGGVDIFSDVDPQ